MADTSQQEKTNKPQVSDIEKQTQEKLDQDSSNVEGAEELIEAHLDEVAGGNFGFASFSQVTGQ